MRYEIKTRILKGGLEEFSIENEKLTLQVGGNQLQYSLKEINDIYFYSKEDEKDYTVKDVIITPAYSITDVRYRGSNLSLYSEFKQAMLGNYSLVEIRLR